MIDTYSHAAFIFSNLILAQILILLFISYFDFDK